MISTSLRINLTPSTYPECDGGVLRDATVPAQPVHVTVLVDLRAAVPHRVIGRALHVEVTQVALIPEVVHRQDRHST